MKRKITEKMLEWKQTSCGRTALLIDGARRVGKSYAVKEFAKSQYKSHILIDFNEAEHFEGYKMVCLNCIPSLASDYLNDCKDFEKYDLICTFYFCPRTSQWNFSIRKTDTADEKITLVPIWEKYNKIRSGGHKGAGSIRCNSFKYDSVSKLLELIF